MRNIKFDTSNKPKVRRRFKFTSPASRVAYYEKWFDSFYEETFIWLIDSALEDLFSGRVKEARAMVGCLREFCLAIPDRRRKGYMLRFKQLWECLYKAG